MHLMQFTFWWLLKNIRVHQKQFRLCINVHVIREHNPSLCVCYEHYIFFSLCILFLCFILSSCLKLYGLFQVLKKALNMENITSIFPDALKSIPPPRSVSRSDISCIYSCAAHNLQSEESTLLTWPDNTHTLQELNRDVMHTALSLTFTATDAKI